MSVQLSWYGIGAWKSQEKACNTCPGIPRKCQVPMWISIEPGKARISIGRNTLEKPGVYQCIGNEPGKAMIMIVPQRIFKTMPALATWLEIFYLLCLLLVFCKTCPNLMELSNTLGVSSILFHQYLVNVKDHVWSQELISEKHSQVKSQISIFLLIQWLQGLKRD